MTLAIAWVRKIRDCDELIIAADSRLCGGKNMDFCQKIILPPRSDCFICCAGETQFTYPLAHLVSTAIGDYERARDRSMDIRDVKGHVCRVLNEAVSHIYSPIIGERIPQRGTEFLFGGWSWIEKRFLIWRIAFRPSDGGFTPILAPRWFSHSTIAVAGDLAREAKEKLNERLHQKYGVWPTQCRETKFSLDWEPFELLRDLLRSGDLHDDSSIGGPPQVVKIYQHQNARRIGVYWPRKAKGKLTISGRALLGYETPNAWMLDPDTLITSNPGLAKSAVPDDVG